MIDLSGSQIVTVYDYPDSIDITDKDKTTIQEAISDPKSPVKPPSPHPIDQAIVQPPDEPSTPPPHPIDQAVMQPTDPKDDEPIIPDEPAIQVPSLPEPSELTDEQILKQLADSLKGSNLEQNTRDLIYGASIPEGHPASAPVVHTGSATEVMPNPQSGAKKLKVHTKLDYSLFASLAYESKDKRVEAMNEFTRDGKYFKYLPRSSTDEMAIFRGNDGSYVFGLRGSATAEDWTKSDVAIAKGNIYDSARYIRDERQIIDFMSRNRLKPEQVVVTGHSLGGALSSALAAKNKGIRAVGYNSGFSPLALRNNEYLRRGDYRSDNIVNYITAGDVISNTALLPKYPRTYLVPHTEYTWTTVAFENDLIDRHSIGNFTNILQQYKQERGGDLFNPSGKQTDVSSWRDIQIKKDHPDPGEESPLQTKDVLTPEEASASTIEKLAEVIGTEIEKGPEEIKQSEEDFERKINESIRHNTKSIFEDIGSGAKKVAEAINPARVFHFHF